jgi:hypothetical protein
MIRLRLGLSLAGFVAAILAVMTDDHRVVWLAIGLLSASFLLRVLQRKSPREHSEDKPDIP